VHGPGAADEHPVGELHDVGLVEDRDLRPPPLSGVAGGPPGDPGTGALGGHLGAGDDAGSDLGFDAGVESLRVLPDDHEVHSAEAGGHPLQVADGPDGVEVEALAEAHVDGDEPLSDGRGAWPLERHPVLADGIQRLLRQHVLPVLEGAESGPTLHPGDRRVGRLQDPPDSLGDFRSDPIPRDDHHLMLIHRMASMSSHPDGGVRIQWTGGSSQA
jgi:hypothetical protein